MYADASALRIISDDLWKRVQQRKAAQRQTARGNKEGRKPRYLFSGLLVCPECGQHYIIRSNGYYGCATHMNRGKLICSNSRMVRQDRLEEVLLRLIFDEVFSPQTVAYIAEKVNEALARRDGSHSEQRKRLESELAKVRAEAENIKSAVKLGKATAALLEMLEEAQQRTAELEASLKVFATKRDTVAVLPSVVQKYLGELRATLNHNAERARELLAQLLGPITLRPMGDKLIAELKGNLPALLEMDEALYNCGAGRGI